MINLGEDSKSPGRELNSGAPENECRVLNTGWQT
jgi:hypothetical protein